MKYTILGAGLAGLSTAYHLGHQNCILFEKNNYPGGHIHSEKVNGFVWDVGPHVSFTENDYVKDLFIRSVNNNILEYDVNTVNYWNDCWIPHPAQSNLYAIPEPLRTKCLFDLVASRNKNRNTTPLNYDKWLRKAFGDTFTNEFPAKYTRKYWTVDPKYLSVNWIGKRLFFPSVNDVKQGSLHPLKRQTHYVKKVLYPKIGGYQSFGEIFLNNANIIYNKKVKDISFNKKEIIFTDGRSVQYDRLISTLPLPEFILSSDAPSNIKEDAKKLKCSSFLLVNVIADHQTVKSENWIYVYDENMYSTRIYCTENMSPYNGKPGKTGIQVEVYFSDFKKKNVSDNYIAENVIRELIKMGLIKSYSQVNSYLTRWIPWGNVIFDLEYKKKLNNVLSYLENYSLVREYDDLEPLTDWNNKETVRIKLGKILLAGRYAQWKYYWSDDCVLRGRYIKTNINK